jgi:hypothetical protein
VADPTGPYKSAQSVLEKIAMPAPIGNARDGDVETLVPQEQKASSEASSATTSGPSQTKSGLVGMSCPGVITLPDAQPATNFLFGTNVSGANAQNQSGVCYVQPPQLAAQTLPASAAQNTNAAPSISAATPAALIANCHDVDDVVKVLEGLTGPDQQPYAVDVVNLALRRFDGVDDIKNLTGAVRDNARLHRLVVEQVLHRAAELEQKSTPENRDALDGPHRQACAGCPEGRHA